MAASTPGEMALHEATKNGNFEDVRVLLRRCHVDPNTTDSQGWTPLLAACDTKNARADVVRLLLQADAIPSVADTAGYTPLHAVAFRGHTDLVDMLYAREPDTLNCCTAIGLTPLSMACAGGHKSMVSKLLSLGAMQLMPWDDSMACPLLVAARNGFVDVVRVMIHQGGIRAIGGEAALPRAMLCAIQYRQAVILRMLLEVGGEQRRAEWANNNHMGARPLHVSAGYCYPAAVSVLLEAGADETVHDPDGRTPCEIIGDRPRWTDPCREDPHPMHRREEVAIRRMLDRGPAYRSRSWAWPVDGKTDAGVSSGDNDGDTTATAAVLLTSPA